MEPPASGVRSSSPGTVRLAFAAAVAVMCIIAAASVASLQRFSEDARLVAHTLGVTQHLEALSAALSDAESEQRAYILTEDQVFLSGYSAALHRAERETNALQRLIRDNAVQHRRLAGLKQLTEERLAILASNLEDWQSNRRSLLRANLMAGKGKMTQIAARIEEMRAEELGLLAARNAAFQRQRVITIFTLVLGNALALVFLAFAFHRLVREAAERARAESAATARAREVEDLYENAPCGYHSLDASGKFIRINSTELQWLGYQREEVIGKLSIADLLTPESRQVFERTYPQFKASGMLTDVEFDLVCNDGALLPVSISATAVRDDAGAYVASRSTVFDISKRREAELRMREAHTFLESVLENIPALVAIKDAKDLRFLRLNRAGEELLGLRREQVAGKTSLELFDSHKGAVADHADREALAIGGVVDVAEEPVHRPDGARRLVHTRKVAIQNARGELAYVLAVSQDITDRKRAEEQVLQMNRELEVKAAQLEAINKELDSFTYSVSHDLRSPLRAIGGFALMLEEEHGERLDDEGRRLLAVIRDNGKKMGQLIDDLLAFSQLGRKAINPSRLEVRVLVEEAFAAATVDGKRPAPTLVLGPLPDSWGDRALLPQVWANLISNAVKYSAKREQPAIEVRGCVQNGHTVYEVRDNGAGFDMRYYEKLFGVFQRLHSPADFPGTGVGLALVQRIVTRHGGRVWAEGKVGQGASFYFSLPTGGAHEAA